MVENDGFVDWDDVGDSVAGIDDYAGGETLVGMSAFRSGSTLCSEEKPTLCVKR